MTLIIYDFILMVHSSRTVVHTQCLKTGPLAATFSNNCNTVNTLCTQNN